MKTKQIALSFSLFYFIGSPLALKTENNRKSDIINSVLDEETLVKGTSPATTAKTVAKKWTADSANTKVTFTIKGPFGTVDGTLSGLKSTIFFDENDLAGSSFQASVDSRTISTGIKLRNHDLQKEKYLDADNHPLVSFHSERIKKTADGYKAAGTLTLKGITKAVEIPFTFTEKKNSGVFKGAFTIQRGDYGVGKSGGSIGSTVSIKLEVPVTR